VAQPTLPQFFSPGFPQLLDTLLGPQIRRVDSIFQQSLPACQYEHPEFGMCGRESQMSDLESQRPLCARHARMLEMNSRLEVL
jgi:hypothetical protein